MKSLKGSNSSSCDDSADIDSNSRTNVLPMSNIHNPAVLDAESAGWSIAHYKENELSEDPFPMKAVIVIQPRFDGYSRSVLPTTASLYIVTDRSPTVRTKTVADVISSDVITSESKLNSNVKALGLDKANASCDVITPRELVSLAMRLVTCLRRRYISRAVSVFHPCLDWYDAYQAEGFRVVGCVQGAGKLEGYREGQGGAVTPCSYIMMKDVGQVS